MHDFPDLESLTAVVQQLQECGLVQALSPPGRGQTFAHTLYPPDEQQYLAQKVFAASSQDEATSSTSPTGSAAARPTAPSSDVVEQLQQRLEQLESEVEQLRDRLDRLER